MNHPTRSPIQSPSAPAPVAQIQDQDSGGTGRSRARWRDCGAGGRRGPPIVRLGRRDRGGRWWGAATGESKHGFFSGMDRNGSSAHFGYAIRPGETER